MQRLLHVEPIDKSDYDIRSLSWKIPTHRNSKGGIRDEKGNFLFRGKKFFNRLLEDITYSDLSNLLMDVPDEQQKIHSVWPPDYLPRGLARRVTNCNRMEYYHELSIIENELPNIIIELIKPSNCNLYDQSDILNFTQFETGWHLMTVHIRYFNFDLYNFKSRFPVKLETAYSVTAVKD